MPFYERFDERTGEPIVDRTQTGPPKPSPSTGTIRAEDGSIVADSATIVIPPPTPVNVDLPSPFEPVIDANGRITPRWWRFLDQMYRRTGGVIDNINRVPTSLIGASSASTVAMTITGKVPLVSKLLSLGAPASMTIASSAPTVFGFYNPIEVGAPASMSITGAAPTVSVLISVPTGSAALTGITIADVDDGS